MRSTAHRPTPLRRAATWAARPALAVLLGLAVMVGPRPAAAQDPELNAAASFFLPGLGQAVNGDWDAAAYQGTSAVVLARQYTLLTERDDYIEPADRENEETNTIRINRTSFEADLYGTAFLNLSFYSSFAAYRDARSDPSAAGYTTPVPSESLGDLMAAPFSWRFLSRPGTFVPLLVPLYLISTGPSDEQLIYAPEGDLTRSEMATGFFFEHQAVAIGEEAFFRGFLNNGLSDSLGEPLGLVGSSALFGLGHAGNAGQASAASAFVFGLYLGWLHQQNDYFVGQGVALHYWWNFLTSVALLQEREEAHVNLLTFNKRF